MDDRIGRLVASAGVDRAAADNAAGTPLFLRKHGPTATVRALIQHMLGTDAVRPSLGSTTSSSSPCVFSANGRRPGVANRMIRLSLRPMQTAIRETISFASETAGEDAAARLVGAIPGRCV
jgi:hypothetical protein